MADEDKPTDKPVLPGNHGQFGANNGTDDALPLEDHPSPGKPGTQGPKQTGAGERS